MQRDQRDIGEQFRETATATGRRSWKRADSNGFQAVLGEIGLVLAAALGVAATVELLFTLLHIG